MSIYRLACGTKIPTLTAAMYRVCGRPARRADSATGAGMCDMCFSELTRIVGGDVGHDYLDGRFPVDRHARLQLVRDQGKALAGSGYAHAAAAALAIAWGRDIPTLAEIYAMGRRS